MFFEWLCCGLFSFESVVVGGGGSNYKKEGWFLVMYIFLEGKKIIVLKY